MAIAKTEPVKKKRWRRPGHPGARLIKHAKGRLEVQLGLRLDAVTAARLDEISERLLLISRPAIARAALAFGLDVIDVDPALLFFSDDKERAERVLATYWNASEGSRGVEYDDDKGTYIAWLDHRGAAGSGDGGGLGGDSGGRVRAESHFSFRDALTKLGRQVPPRRPLPWWPRPQPTSAQLGLPRRPR
jgi:hypothetical protein